MPLDVVGTGFGRTGTNSLKLALEQLGFGPCHHMFEVRDRPEQIAFWAAAASRERSDWDTVFQGFRATVDWPSAYFWREIAAHYPKAKVLLSVRPEQEWLKSIHATIYQSLQARRERPTELQRAIGEMAYDIIERRTFDERLGDPEHALAVYRAHVAAVKAAIAPERLLVYDVAEGWAPLCRHLGVPIPAAPFPRTNSTEEFRARVVARQQSKA
ncbi:MAG: sulfotransferase [Hyphomicrobiaceae bacterium]|nr:sulfotransferase [Hyphomicrobiaceae bacterium]